MARKNMILVIKCLDDDLQNIVSRKKMYSIFSVKNYKWTKRSLMKIFQLQENNKKGEKRKEKIDI